MKVKSYITFKGIGVNETIQEYVKYGQNQINQYTYVNLQMDMLNTGEIERKVRKTFLSNSVYCFVVSL